MTAIDDPDLAAIIDTAAGMHGLSRETLLGRSRKRPAPEARAVAYAELVDRGWGPTQIGRVFGRSHATVLNALEGRG
jgi:chromosomal replication initiation ATPase DnaA